MKLIICRRIENGWMCMALTTICQDWNWTMINYFSWIMLRYGVDRCDQKMLCRNCDHRSIRRVWSECWDHCRIQKNLLKRTIAQLDHRWIHRINVACGNGSSGQRNFTFLIYLFKYLFSSKQNQKKRRKQFAQNGFNLIFNSCNYIGGLIDWPNFSLFWLFCCCWKKNSIQHFRLKSDLYLNHVHFYCTLYILTIYSNIRLRLRLHINIFYL